MPGQENKINKNITKVRVGYAAGSDGTRAVSSVRISVTLGFSTEEPSITVISGLQGLMVTVNSDARMLEPEAAVNGELDPT